LDERSQQQQGQQHRETLLSWKTGLFDSGEPTQSWAQAKDDEEN
jgi:hypothetical protein